MRQDIFIGPNSNLRHQPLTITFPPTPFSQFASSLELPLKSFLRNVCAFETKQTERANVGEFAEAT